MNNIMNSSIDYNMFPLVSHHTTTTTSTPDPSVNMVGSPCYQPPPPPPPQQPHSPRLPTLTGGHLNHSPIQQQFMPPTCSQELKPVNTYSDTQLHSTQSFNSFLTEPQPPPPIFGDHAPHPVTVSQSHFLQDSQLASQLTSLAHIKHELIGIGGHCNGADYYAQAINFISKTPPVSPINMEEQEKVKLERKRMRNREAASKCRRRKLEKISKLEQRVGELKIENNTLSRQLSKLKEHVCSLKKEVIEHMQSGCPIVPPDQSLLCF